MKFIGKKKSSLLKRFVSWRKVKTSKLENSSAKTNSSFNSQDSSRYIDVVAPNTPDTLPGTPNGKDSGEEDDGAGCVARNTTSAYSPGLLSSTFQDLSTTAISRRDWFDVTGDFHVEETQWRSGTDSETKYEIDQCERIISTEDRIVSIYSNDGGQKRVPVNGGILRMLEESQNEILASKKQQKTGAAIAVERSASRFGRLPEHPALGNLEKFRSGLVETSGLDGVETIEVCHKDEVLHKKEVSDCSDHSTDRASVADGLKSLWDETTKNIESMNRVLSACTLDTFRPQQRKGSDDITYRTGYERKTPLKGSWLEVPGEHLEEISVLSNPNEISSGLSHLDEDPVGDVRLLQKKSAPIEIVHSESDDVVPENSKSRFLLWP
eukprot:scaffold3250_cov105-Cylindrotheca_fusiformis.AAC.2